MDRRRFLQGMVVATAGVGGVPLLAEMDEADAPRPNSSLTAPASINGAEINTEGHTLLCSFTRGSEKWKVYEDLRTREGAIVFISTSGVGRVLTKSAEATFAEDNPPYLGLNLKDIGMAGADLLADRLLKNGDPDPEEVKSAAPPHGSAPLSHPYERVGWDTFVGTRECLDTMPVYPSGNTRTYHPVQSFPALNGELARKRYEGLLGGWLPAVRKVMPVSDTEHYEVVVFGDVTAHDKFIVQTWHRTAHIENGKIVKVEYGHSYPAFPPARQDPDPEEFYRSLLEFTLYWEKQVKDVAPASLPHKAWVDMSTYAFVKEQMVRPGGVYPKYGAVDRDYYGSEYDGFQDIFTSALYTNLEWGRFEMAAQVLDNYYSDFVDAKGMINMRGPETAQFGLTLSLLARYYYYTGDRTLLLKHREKIEATATVLTQLHDESLKLPHEDPGYGLIHGWSESDSCLAPQPMIWWQPYFNNSAFAARGLKDIARAWKEINRGKTDAAVGKMSDEWLMHSKKLEDAVVT
ncbi:MAG: Tat pathway signal protein, partial [Edaphobacter sp.]